MNKWILTLLLAVPLCAVAQEGSEEINYNRLSETLGHLIVKQLDQAGFPFSSEKVIRGIRDAKAGKPSPMNEEEYEQVMCNLQEQLFLKTAENNLAMANAFLKENASKAGIQSLDPKLQVKVTHEGSGAVIDAESIPLIHYKGSLIDGTVFASSETLGEPVALPLKQSIPGFSKGLVGMKEGEKRMLFIHPELAYGVAGQLPPNSLLIFEVEAVKANTISQAEIAQLSAETPVN